jgi:hypothetical protein
MIDKLNIPLENKLTKKIRYTLSLDRGFWRKTEYDTRGKGTYFETSSGYWHKKEYNTRGNEIYYEDCNGYWVKKEYDNEGKRIYFENSSGYIKYD